MASRGWSRPFGLERSRPLWQRVALAVVKWLAVGLAAFYALIAIYKFLPRPYRKWVALLALVGLVRYLVAKRRASPRNARSAPAASSWLLFGASRPRKSQLLVLRSEGYALFPHCHVTVTTDSLSKPFPELLKKACRKRESILFLPCKGDWFSEYATEAQVSATGELYEFEGLRRVRCPPLIRRTARATRCYLRESQA